MQRRSELGIHNYYASHFYELQICFSLFARVNPTVFGFYEICVNEYVWKN